MRAKEEAFRILETALSIASAGVEDVEVALGGGDLGITPFANNYVLLPQEQSHEMLTIRVGSKRRMAKTETSDLSTAGIQAASQQARALIEHIPESSQPLSFPAPQAYWPVDAYDPEIEAMSGLDRMAAVGRAIVLAHKQGLSASGFMGTRRGSIGFDNTAGVYAIANTRGLLAYHGSTASTYSVTMLGSMNASGWAEDESFAIAGIDVEELSRTAVRKASAGAGMDPGIIEPGRYTVVLEPAAVAGLLRYLALTSGAADMEAERSFLSGTRGQTIAGQNVTIYDDHTHPLHRGRPFDVEGVAKKKVVLIKKGVAEGPVYSWSSAAKANVEATGHKVVDAFFGEREAASNLVLEGGTATLSDLVGSTKSGVLVTRFSDTRLVEPRSLLVTGVTRDGLFLIENGEIIGPVRNMRFNVSVIDVLNNVEAMTAPVWALGLVVPAAKVHAFRFSSGTKL
jgi:predicted Zn-dependent protease